MKRICDENCTSYYMALKIIDSFNNTNLAEEFEPSYNELKSST